MYYKSDRLLTGKTYNLDELVFEYVPAHPESFYRCYLEEDSALQIAYSFTYNDGCSCSLAYGDGKHWADSGNTADWPILDKTFGGREAWQTFIAKLAAAEQKEVLGETLLENITDSEGRRFMIEKLLNDSQASGYKQAIENLNDVIDGVETIPNWSGEYGVVCNYSSDPSMRELVLQIPAGIGECEDIPLEELVDKIVVDKLMKQYLESDEYEG